MEDSNGNELSNTSISWNDSTNADWYDQWLTICNSMFNRQFTFYDVIGQSKINIEIFKNQLISKSHIFLGQ